MAKFTDGNAGRPKGAKAKVNTNLRDWVTEFVNSQKEQLESDFKALDPMQRVQAFERLLKYSLPTLQATSLTTDFAAMGEEELDIIINRLKQSAIENDNEDR